MKGEAMAKSFSAQVDERIAAYKKRLTATFRGAAQDLANEVKKPKSEGGHMPILTGALRRSLMASTAAMPGISDAEDFPNNDGQITLTIAGADIGETIYLGFQAAHARRREYGFNGNDSLGRTYNEEGNGFVRLTAQRWQEFVDANAAKAIRAFP
ncbi:hypothetical protein [uncultured Nitratireductor sp.]|uniref:hypothetical protein n=1 Tax=uncultured Nitratireductor sp. TaxID=520953 RepID=UPI002609C692|nr:hypothetical protein [uncultured Nitratireductor sp.]